MGVGFWVIQAVFVVAAIATAIHVERERHTTSGARHVPIQPGMEFTIQQQARLLRLRQRVREARFGSERLYDDLAPDRSAGRTPELSSTWGGASVDVDGAPAPRQCVSASAIVLVVGVVLMLVGTGGVWRTTLAMDAVGETGAFVERYVPGSLADPGKYFAAVNSAAARNIPVGSAALDRKRNMDRWEAVLCVGAAMLLAAVAQRTQSGNESSTMGYDLVVVCLLIALLCGGLSFFELA